MFKKFLFSERGAAHPFLVIGAVVVFGAVSVGIMGTLQTATATAQQTKVNTTLAAAVSDVAQRVSSNGYMAARDLDDRTYVPVTVGNHTVDALQTVDVNEDSATATITVRAGKYAHGDWFDPDTCVDVPSNCMSATTTAKPSLSQTIPEPAGMKLVDESANVIDGDETRWRDLAVGEKHVAAIDQDGVVWRWGTDPTSGDVRTRPERVDTVVAFTQVVATSTATVAVDEAGRGWSWGRGDNGQLGHGDTANAGSPKALPNSFVWDTVAAGATDVCGITTDSELYCWGEHGSMIAGTEGEHVTAPHQIEIPDDESTGVDESTFGFTDVSVGARHIVAADERGNVYSWGYNDVGQLGVGSKGGSVRDAPVKLTASGDALANARIVTVGAGRGNGYAIDQFGRLWGWGLNNHHQAGDGTNVNNRLEPVRIGGEAVYTDVHGGHQQAFAVTRDGHIHAWGSNSNGLIGESGTIKTPSEVSFIDPDPVTGDTAVFLRLALSPAKSTSIFALDSTHRVWMWGKLPAGMAGNGETGTQTLGKPRQSQMHIPTAVMSATDVAAGSSHVATVNSEGEAYVWEPGDTPVKLEETEQGARIVQVGASGNLTTTLSDAGYLWSTGYERYLIPGATGHERVENPVRISDDRFVDLSVNNLWSMAIGVDGRAYEWGNNTATEVFDSNKSFLTTPQQVNIPDDPTVVDVAAGFKIRFILDEAGTVWATGRGSHALGIGDEFEQGKYTPPTEVPFPDGVRIVAIDAGSILSLGAATYALDAEGGVWAWGTGDESLGNMTHLGTGTTGDVRTPAKLDIPERIVQIAAGGLTSSALTANGDVYTWGVGIGPDDDDELVINEDHKTNRPTPVKLDIGEQLTNLDSGLYSEGFGIDRDGDIWSWGWGIGIGTDSFPSGGDYEYIEPAQRTTGIEFVQVNRSSLTGTHALASDGRIYKAGGSLAEEDFEPGFFLDEDSADLNESAATDATRFTEDRTTDVAAAGGVTAFVNGGRVWLHESGGLRLTSIPDGARDVDVNTDGTVIARMSNGTVYTNGTLIRNRGTEPTGAFHQLPFPPSARDVAVSPTAVGVVFPGKTIVWGTDENAVPCDTILCTVDSGGDTLTLGTDSGYVGSETDTVSWGIASGSLDDSVTFRDVAASSTGGLVFAGARANGSVDVVQKGGARHTLTPDGNTNIITVAVGGAGESGILGIGIDDTSNVWWFNSTGEIVPFEVDTDPEATPTLVPVEVPHVLETEWRVADVTGTLDGGVQVDIDTDLPINTVAFECSDGSRTGKTAPQPSSGDYEYANIDDSVLAGCGAPRLIVSLNGWPLDYDEIDTVVMPIVGANGLPEGWGQ